VGTDRKSRKRRKRNRGGDRQKIKKSTASGDREELRRLLLSAYVVLFCFSLSAV
jgi:hypothetical protein